jgi:hypothetical protein
MVDKQSKAQGLSLSTSTRWVTIGHSNIGGDQWRNYLVT